MSVSAATILGLAAVARELANLIVQVRSEADISADELDALDAQTDILHDQLQSLEVPSD